MPGGEIIGMFSELMGIVLIINAIVGLIPAFIAKKKERNFILWWIYGTIVPVIAFIHSLIIV